MSFYDTIFELASFAYGRFPQSDPILFKLRIINQETKLNL